MRSVKTYFSICAAIFIFVCPATFAQNVNTDETEHGGEYPIGRNDAAHPCITPQEYQVIDQRIAENIKLLKLDRKAYKTTLSTTLSWPLQTANGLNDCGYYFIANYVDQDTATGSIKDYHCGTVTYDGHRGTDIATAPYPFLKMDNNQVDVIAAAPGTIIDKSDGHFDKNCAMSSATANYIIIQHADGSCALYWHMKKFSLTSKVIGDAVAAGEFLGVVGSSGSSTAPHLHLEVWSGNTSSTLNDAWAGTCNYLNSASWWAAQKPYTEPAIIKAQTSIDSVILPPCPATETNDEDSCLSPGGIARFYIFLRNETIGMTANESIVNPDGTTFSSWVHNSTTNYLASYWYFIRTLPTTPGIYTFKTVYNGAICSKRFFISCSTLGIPTMSILSGINVFPNPANNTINIVIDGGVEGNCKLTLKNLIGQTMLTDNATVENNTVQKTMSIAALPNGIYFLEIETDGIRTVKKK